MWFGTCVESFRAVKIKKTAWVNTNLMYYSISIKKLPNEKLGSRKILFLSRRAESAFATLGICKLVSLGEIHRKEGSDNKLSHSLTVIDGGVCFGMVVERYHDLASVVGVNYAYLVCGSKTALCGDSASRIDKSAVTLGDLKRNTCGDELCFVRADHCLISVDTRVKIGTGRIA